MRGRRRLDRWIFVPLAVMAAIAAADLATGPDVVLIAVLIAGPLLAALRLDALHTAAVSVVALLLSVVLGIEDGRLHESGYLTRVPSLVLAGTLAVWLARLRVQREAVALLLAVQGSVSRLLNESRTLRDAAPRLLRGIGEALGWDVGAVWTVDDESGRIRRVEGWSAEGFEAPTFEAVSDLASYPRGEGLPGRVWDTGMPVSLPDYAADPSFPRAGAARADELAGAFAFPLRGGRGVVGVIEFLSTEPRLLGAPQLETFSGLGRQIGQFIERRRSEEQRAELLERERAARRDAERAELRAAETVALLDTLLARAPIGFAFVDGELRCLRVNDALARISGHRPGELVGRPAHELMPGLPQVPENVRRVLEQGQAVTDVEVSGGTFDSDPERHWIQSYYPVRGVHDELLGVGMVVMEITDRKRAERRASFLAEATASLTASLDREVTLANIARLAVPRLADWCVVDVVDAESRRIRRLAAAHGNAAKQRLLWEVGRSHPLSLDHDPGAAAAIRSGAARVHHRLEELLPAQAGRREAHLRALQDAGFASAMCVPLPARGQAVGAITFGSADPRRPFAEGDLGLAEEVAARAGVAIENARLYRERSHIARTLQESLLPPRLPEIPGVELAARYRAAGEEADVGGDFYDVFPTSERTWGAVVGDVLGKGAGAAAMIGLARHTLRAAAMREPDSKRILATLNEALYREGVEESFCTAVYLALDVADEVSVELTCAGHPLPLVLHSDGTLESAGRPGTLLGAIPKLALAPQRVRLLPGDTLVAFTDGVLEARSDHEVFGEERLRRLLADLSGASAADIAERVTSQAIEFQSGSPRDDLAVLVVRRAAGAAEPRTAASRPLGVATAAGRGR